MNSGRKSLFFDKIAPFISFERKLIWVNLGIEVAAVSPFEGQ